MTKQLPKRAGRKRMELAFRQAEIIRAVAHITLGDHNRATLTRIARKMGMTPSTHLNNMIQKMADNEALIMTSFVNGRGQTVRNYDVFTEEQTGCELPWVCDGRSFCTDWKSVHVCVGTGGNDD